MGPAQADSNSCASSVTEITPGVTEDDGRDLPALRRCATALPVRSGRGGQDCRGGAHWLDPPAVRSDTRRKKPVGGFGRFEPRRSATRLRSLPRAAPRIDSSAQAGGDRVAAGRPPCASALPFRHTRAPLARRGKLCAPGVPRSSPSAAATSGSARVWTSRTMINVFVSLAPSWPFPRRRGLDPGAVGRRLQPVHRPAVRFPDPDENGLHRRTRP